MARGVPLPLIVALLAVWCVQAAAGGGGIMQRDRCVLEMDFLKAHLTIYQPRTRASEKFCDSIPDLTRTVFVLDYLHDSLNQAPIEFRVIEDTKGLGRFARWRDIRSLDDIEQVTVFHQPPVQRSGGSYEVEHTFRRQGDYLLVITAGHPTKDEVYHAVAPLEVGGTAWLLWVLLGAVAGLCLLYIGLRFRRGQG